MFASASFFALIVQPSASEEHLARDVAAPCGRVLAGLALLDEPGVLGEPAGVEEERHPVAVADRRAPRGVLERDRLAAAGVVRHGDHHERDVRGARARQQRLERRDVHVALERMLERRVEPLGDDEVDRLGAGDSTFARVVSKCVLFGTTVPGRRSR